MSNTHTDTGIRHPRDAAKDLIRRDMVQQAVINLHLRKSLFRETQDYTAYIDVKKKCVVISKIYGIPIRETYPVYEIMQEILKEVIQSLNTNSKVFLSGKRSDSVF